MNTKTPAKAIWNISLTAFCIECSEYVDLLDYSDFWCGRTHIQAGEHGTDATKDLEVVCPECGHEFNVELTY